LIEPIFEVHRGGMTKQNPPDEPLKIPALSTDQRIAEVEKVRPAVWDALEKERLNLAILEALRYFRGEPPVSVGPRDRLCAELLQSNRRKLGALTPSPAPATYSDVAPVVREALSLIAGGKIPEPEDINTRMTESRRRVAIFEDAWGSLDLKWQELRFDISRETAARLVKRHDALLRKIFDAMLSCCQSLSELKEFRAEFVNAGYDLDAIADILPVPSMPNALSLGQEEKPETELGNLKQLLAYRRAL
jgi:hypothetical protein